MLLILVSGKWREKKSILFAKGAYSRINKIRLLFIPSVLFLHPIVIFLLFVLFCLKFYLAKFLTKKQRIWLCFTIVAIFYQGI